MSIISEYLVQYREIFPLIPKHQTALQERFDVFAFKRPNYVGKKYDHSILILFNFLKYSIDDDTRALFGGNDLRELIIFVARIPNDKVICPYSGKPFPEKLRKTKFPMLAACSMTCQCRIDRVIESKYKMTPDQWVIREEKYKSTMMARYGVTNAGQHSGMVEKMKESLSNRSSLEKEAQKNNRRNTCLKKYGVDNNFKLPETRDQIKQTLLSKYGVDHSSKIIGMGDRIRETNIKKYGVPNTFQIHGVQDAAQKAIADNLTNIRNQRRIKSGISQESIDILDNKFLFEELVTSRGASLAANDLGVGLTTIYRMMDAYDIKAEGSTSLGERALASSIEAMGVEIVRNSRSLIAPMELDIFIPSHNLAIEFNGLYWHSSLHLEKSYHRLKYERCRDAGIRLLMVNEDEWIERSNIVVSKIRNIMGQSERGVGARKLTIRRIDTVTANAFFERYHLQAATGSLIAAYGAYSGNDLVSVIGYNRQRGTQAVELIRYATDGKSYPGIFSRLFRFSRDAESYDEVLSFADLRYSEGNVYKRNGFDLSAEIGPDYKYVLGNLTMHKSSFTKAKIAKRFGVDIADKTERELMESLGIPRIYDCGKRKYIWRR